MCNKKVTKDVFDRVKYSLKMGDRVAFVANKNRLGETTVRRIQKARTYKQYKDLANDRIRRLHSNRNTARVIQTTHTVRHHDNIPEYIALFLSSIVTILAVVALVLSLWGSK